MKNLDIQDVLHYYYQVNRKTIVQVLDLFNDVRIARYNNDTGEILKFVKVPLKFAPKTKHWYWAEKTDANGDKIRDKILPMMAMNLTSVDFDDGRQVSQAYRVKSSRINDREIELFYNPVPYNYLFTLDIVAEYMIDITQIVEQILPFFDPFVFVKLSIPELSIGSKKFGSYPLDIKVICDGGSKEDTISMDESDYRLIKWSFNFKVESYLMKPKFSYPVIKKIISEWAIRSETEKMPLTTVIGLSGEKFPIENIPEADLVGAIYDPDLKILYKYEMES